MYLESDLNNYNQNSYGYPNLKYFLNEFPFKLNLHIELEILL